MTTVFKSGRQQFGEENASQFLSLRTCQRSFAEHVRKREERRSVLRENLAE